MAGKEFFTKMEFDNAAYATDVKNACEKKMGRIKIGMIIAAGATVFDVVAFMLDKGGQKGTFLEILVGTLLTIGVIGAIVSYIVEGGFGTALRWAKNLAVFGWIILPFPADILTGIMFFVLAILAFFCVPIVFVLLNYRQTKKDRDAAEQYLNYVRPVQE